MSLKTVLNTLDGLDDGIKKEYVEKDGKFYLDIDGSLSHTEEVARIKRALDHEKNDHKATKAKNRLYSSFGTPEEIQSRLDSLEELELKKGEGETEAEFQKRVDSMVEIRQKKFDRIKEELEQTLAEKNNVITNLTLKARERLLEDEVRKYTVGEINPKAERNFLIIAKSSLLFNEETNSFETKDGVSVKDWVSNEIMENEYLAPANDGIGANGSRHKSKKTDYSMDANMDRMWGDD